jgi:flavodoxin
MITLDLPTSLERHFRDVIRESYNGDLQAAIAAFLQLHKKYGWKEQLRHDVQAVRAEVRRKGGVKAEVIDSAIQKYRRNSG